MISAIRKCLGFRANEPRVPKYYQTYAEEKLQYSDQAEDDTAADFMAILVQAKEPGTKLSGKLKSITAQSWTESLAQAILAKMERTVRDLIEGKLAVGAALQNAIKKSISAATEFAKDHPVYSSVIAIGVLVLVAPWILGKLGFGKLGPIGGKHVNINITARHSQLISWGSGSFAAFWQAHYAGYVPKGSLFSYLQRLGMVWKTIYMPRAML